MSKEDYVSRETYKLLKEKGYDGEVKTCYDTEGYTCPAIHLYDAMKWLREVYNTHVEISSVWDLETNKNVLFYVVRIYQLKHPVVRFENQYKTYEQACEAAIKYCLVNLI